MIGLSRTNKAESADDGYKAVHAEAMTSFLAPTYTSDKRRTIREVGEDVMRVLYTHHTYYYTIMILAEWGWNRAVYGDDEGRTTPAQRPQSSSPTGRVYVQQRGHFSCAAGRTVSSISVPTQRVSAFLY